MTAMPAQVTSSYMPSTSTVLGTTTPTGSGSPDSGTTTGVNAATSGSTMTYSKQLDERSNVWESVGNMTALSGANSEGVLQVACPSQIAPYGAPSRRLLVLTQGEAWVTLNTSSDFALYVWSPTTNGFNITAAGEGWSNTTELFTNTSDYNPCPRQFNRTSLGIDSSFAQHYNVSQSYVLNPMQNLTISTTTGSVLYIFNLTLFDSGGVVTPTSATSLPSDSQGVPAQSPGSGSGFQLALVAVPLGIALAFFLGFLAFCYERRRRRTAASIFHSGTGPYADTDTWRTSEASNGSIASSLPPQWTSFERTDTSNTLVSQQTSKPGHQSPPTAVLFSPLSSATPNSAHPLLGGYNADPFADGVVQERRMSEVSMISSRNRLSIIMLQPEIASLRRTSSTNIQPPH